MVFANVHEVAKAKGLDLLLNIHQDVQPELVGDNVKLRQVLINLIGNAVKFTDSGSVCVNVLLKDERLRFEVVDSGVGISPSDIAELFQPFTQLRKGQDCGGAGLGLSISYRLVKAMGGELQVESEVGKGSNFYFTIPYQICRVGIEEKADTSLQPAEYTVEIEGRLFSKRQILVVDDSFNVTIQHPSYKSGIF